ncbi:type II secretion system minor pseudopilin GspK [Jeongeupia naejangsanensis]|uniref:Type II secretion system protein K n=1 Tax=Jeongeupia naejangsanensis TaxID=613195 RepID=A0ABS2BGS9_9NEIS|nr:type II secretion system minor pseudopilin GspK [Jeongeupia naejangsanensis]MBM3114811.1 type II secretion system minor pseudopilin GspK [Jeongeupia naejangsanensis]
MTPRRQTGIALITAVITAALVAALAAWIAWRQQLWFFQLENQLDQGQARVIAYSGVQLARFTLRDDARNNQVDHLGEPWNVPIPAIPVEQGKVGGRLLEQQGRFNLNNLVSNGLANENEVAACRRLFELVGVSPQHVDALVDWLDADGEARPGGAEDAVYLALPQPYRAANQPLTDLASLVRIQGFDAGTIERITPFVAVLPPQTPINVNFASPEVIAAVVPALTLAEGQAVVSRRAGHHFGSVAEFVAALPERARGQLRFEALTVQSRYFISEVDAQFGRVTVRYAALLERNGPDFPKLIWMRRR